MNQSNKEIKDFLSSVDLSKVIMHKIKTGGIKIKSRWLFYTQKLGLRSGFVLSILVLSVLINIFLYILKQNGALEFLDFGIAGMNIVLSNIPYDLVLLIIVFAILANLVLKTFDINHKKYFYILSVISIIISGCCGIAIFSSGINDTIRQKIEQQQKVPVVNKFYGSDRFILDGRSSLIGQVVEYKIISQPFLVITKQGEMVTVYCESCLSQQNDFFTIGQVIKAVGQKQKDFFNANQIKLISNNQVFQPILGPMPQIEIQVSQ